MSNPFDPYPDPWQSELWLQVCRKHQERLNRQVRSKPPKPWMPGTEPAALKRAMRRHWPRDPARCVRRIIIRGGQPCGT